MMINRLLCFMWGHVPEEITGAVLITMRRHGDYPCQVTENVTITKCKHCGKRL